MATIPTATARMPPFSERGLMRAAARGERRAFEQIYRRYHQQLYRYCYAILRRESDAEDALQATMAAALRSLPGEKREVSLRSWLYRVAHNEAITLLRGRSKQADPEQAPEPARQSVEAEYAERERFEVILTDLGELPERQRSALVMRELSGLSYEEIGEALDCSGGAARQIVYESRVALQLREEGRTVSCEEIRRAVSDGDRRRLRGRKLKAHLSACESCRDFERGIGERRTTLQASPPCFPRPRHRACSPRSAADPRRRAVRSAVRWARAAARPVCSAVGWRRRPSPRASRSPPRSSPPPGSAR
jgi:RNA polymerase sigma factor (sigma-70 family)